MFFIIVPAILVILFVVKHGDDNVTILKKIAAGVVLTLLLLWIWILVGQRMSAY